MKSIAAFVSGLLFALGLFTSGMTQPDNIIGFLDFFGHWRPALAFVMAGAVGVYAAFYPLITKRQAPLFSPAFDIPPGKKWDAKLIVGAAAFGIGWGIGGFCPGPALVALGTGAPQTVVFLLSLAAGVVLHRLASQNGSSRTDSTDSCG